MTDNAFDLRALESFIQALTTEAGAMILARFGKDGVHKIKSGRTWDVVTKADMAAEKFIVDRIKQAYPDHGIIAEEGSSTNVDAEYVWTVDPIDGTANFAVGVPLFGVMIAVYRSNEGVMAATDLPAIGERYFAKAGGGAYLNGKRIHCSDESRLSHSFGMASLSVRGRTGKLLRRLFEYGDDSRTKLGAYNSTCANACYVASGRRDWFVQLVANSWDFAPVALILKEAGCTVTDAQGTPWRLGCKEVVAANPSLHQQLLALTKAL